MCASHQTVCKIKIDNQNLKNQKIRKSENQKIRKSGKSKSQSAKSRKLEAKSGDYDPSINNRRASREAVGRSDQKHYERQRCLEISKFLLPLPSSSMKRFDYNKKTDASPWCNQISNCGY
jgi:hypothetical protein